MWVLGTEPKLSARTTKSSFQSPDYSILGSYFGLESHNKRILILSDLNLHLISNNPIHSSAKQTTFKLEIFI